jgi:hypothetical protein
MTICSVLVGGKLSIALWRRTTKRDEPFRYIISLHAKIIAHSNWDANVDEHGLNPYESVEPLQDVAVSL